MLDGAPHNGFSVKSLIWMVWSLSNSCLLSLWQLWTDWDRHNLKLTTHRSVTCCKLVDWLFLTFLYFKILIADFIEENVNPLPSDIFSFSQRIFCSQRFPLCKELWFSTEIFHSLRSTVCCLGVPFIFFSSVSVTIFALMLSENYAWLSKSVVPKLFLAHDPKEIWCLMFETQTTENSRSTSS